MVGAVNLGVAVQAVLRQQIRVGGNTWQAAASSRQTRVESGRVTLLTQERGAGSQHGVIDRPVRLMAVAAVLRDWRMFEQERASLFGVAAVAVVIEGWIGEQGFSAAAVGIMAVRTGCAALLNGVPRPHPGGRPDLGMTLKTKSTDRYVICCRVLVDVDSMALAAGEVGIIMLAAGPPGLFVSTVAGDTGRILYLHRARVFATEHGVGCIIIRVLEVAVANPVTGGAASSHTAVAGAVKHVPGAVHRLVEAGIVAQKTVGIGGGVRHCRGG